MYYQSDAACSQPNSATPMSQSAIDAEDAYIAAVGDLFNRGDATIGQLIASLGGNPVAFSSGILQTGGDSGVPTLGDPASLSSPPYAPNALSWPAAPGSGPGAGPGGGGAGSAPSGAPGTAAHSRRYHILRRNLHLFGGGPGGGGTPNGVDASLRDGGRRSGVNCAAPEVLPLVTVFPIPMVTPASLPVSAPVAAPIAQPAAAPPQRRAIPSTGNVCADLTLGLLTKDQVTLDQMRYCSVNSYQGSQVPPAWVIQEQARQIAAGTLPKIPFQASPPNTDARGYPSQYVPFFNDLFAQSGLSGVPTSSAPSAAGVFALLFLAAGAMYAFSKGQK
jgi:hypothetical protein